MPNWKHRIEIKKFFTDDESPEAVERVANAIADVVETAPCMRNFRQKDEFRGQTDQDELNYLLEDLYDYCDAKRVWVE